MRLLATVRGSPNIAFVKYWGKRDVQRNLPLNGSISLTLSSVFDFLLLFVPFYAIRKIYILKQPWFWMIRLKTTSFVSIMSINILFPDSTTQLESKVLKNTKRFFPWFNSFDNKQMDICIFHPSPSISNSDQNDQLVSKEQLKNCPIHISTTNSFPTASGLASSASGTLFTCFYDWIGFACLASCLSVVYQVYNKETERDLLNAIVRQGSGSACRSMYFSTSLIE